MKYVSHRIEVFHFHLERGAEILWIRRQYCTFQIQNGTDAMPSSQDGLNYIVEKDYHTVKNCLKHVIKKSFT